MKKTITFLCCLIAAIHFTEAQTTIIASGLASPTGLCHGPNGMLLVAEAGTGANDGKIDMVMPGGMMHTLIYGLPSYFDTATHDVSGTWRPYMMDSTLWVIVGEGPDPDAGSIMRFDMNGMMPGDSMTVADASDIIHIQAWALAQGDSESNVFSAAWDMNGNIFAVDAALNAVLKIDSSGMITRIDTFPPIQNTMTPFPPVIDYVPTKIISDMSGGFLLCNLTGFPFLPGISSIVHVDSMGMNSPMTNGLTQAVDMQMDSASHNIYVLQYGLRDTNYAPVMNSASILRVNMTGGMDTVAMNFGPSAGMTNDSTDGFFVTEILTGNLLHIANTTTGIKEIKSNVSMLNAYPNPVSDNIHLLYTIDESSAVTFTVNDQLGNRVIVRTVGEMSKGAHEADIDLTNTKLSKGVYYVTVTAGKVSRTISVIKN